MQGTDISVKLERGTFLLTLVAVSVAFAFVVVIILGASGL